MLSSSLAFVYTTNNLGSIGKSLFGMESSVLSSHTLADNFSVLIDKNVWLGFVGVDTTGGSSSHHGACSLE